MPKNFTTVQEATKFAEMDMGLQQTGFMLATKVQIPDALRNRFNTGVEPFDVTFGGEYGEVIVPGMTFTFCGVRGTGKTTFITQLMQRIHDYHNGDKICGFTSGEEPVGQLKMSFDRTGVKDLLIANMTYVEDIAEAMEEFDFLVIDSFNSLQSRLDIGPTKLQRYAQNLLISKAKETDCAVGFIMHCNKKGEIKGGTELPHAVDMEMSIERRGKDIRAIVVDKFRFGPIGEVGFMMTESGLNLDEEVDLGEDEESDDEGNGGKRARLKEEHISMIIEVLQEHGEIHYKELFSSVDLSATRINSLIRELQDKGVIEKEGTRKHNMVFRWVGE